MDHCSPSWLPAHLSHHDPNWKIVKQTKTHLQKADRFPQVQACVSDGFSFLAICCLFLSACLWSTVHSLAASESGTFASLLNRKVATIIIPVGQLQRKAAADYEQVCGYHWEQLETECRELSHQRLLLGDILLVGTVLLNVVRIVRVRVAVQTFTTTLGLLWNPLKCCSLRWNWSFRGQLLLPLPSKRSKRQCSGFVILSALWSVRKAWTDFLWKACSSWFAHFIPVPERYACYHMLSISGIPFLIVRTRLNTKHTVSSPGLHGRRIRGVRGI